MGLFGRKKKKQTLFEAATGFDESFISKPCFNDLIIAQGQAAFTNLDLLRIGDPGYLEQCGMGNISFDNADFLKLYNSPLPSPLKSISVSKAKLKQDGFVKDCIVTLSENLEAAKRIGDPTLVQTCAAALNMFSVAAIYFLLQEFPSYKDPYKKMAPAMKYNAGK